MIKFIFIFIMFSFYSVASGADLQILSLKNFSPASEQNHCSDNLAEVAARFNAQTGLEVVRVSCELQSSSHRNLNGIISYVADKPIELTSTLDPSGSLFNADGAYQTQAACLEDLNRSIAQFENVTGLSTLVAYCYHVISNEYALKIDAVGSSLIRPYTSSFVIYDSAESEGENLADDLLREISARNIEIRTSGYASNGFSLRFNLYYYAETRFDFNNFSEIEFETLEQCQVQKQKLLNSFADYEHKPVAISCSANPYRSRLNIITMGKSYVIINGFRHYALPGTYENTEQCESDIARQSLYLDQNSTGNVIAAICSGEERQIKMQFFLRKL